MLHVLGVAATLDHEARDDAVEESAIVMTVACVVRKLATVLGMKFQSDGTKVGVQDDHGYVLGGELAAAGRKLGAGWQALLQGDAPLAAI